MGKERSAEWYDQNYINSNYNLPLEDCGYRGLYESVIDLMPLNKGVKILELGCGTGRLAKLLYDNGYKNYKGVDFSRVAIENARKHAKDCKFSVSNIMADHILELFKGIDIFIILETL
jgi:ubiquinone/menaquinone biosynthesis C-methylase UbiE